MPEIRDSILGLTTAAAVLVGCAGTSEAPSAQGRPAPAPAPAPVPTSQPTETDPETARLIKEVERTQKRLLELKIKALKLEEKDTDLEEAKRLLANLLAAERENREAIEALFWHEEQQREKGK